MTNLLTGTRQCYFTTPYLPSNFPPRVDELLIALSLNRAVVSVPLPWHMVYRHAVICFANFRAIFPNLLYRVADSVTFPILLAIIDPTDTVAEPLTTNLIFTKTIPNGFSFACRKHIYLQFIMIRTQSIPVLLVFLQQSLFLHTLIEFQAIERNRFMTVWDVLRRTVSIQ